MSKRFVGRVSARVWSVAGVVGCVASIACVEGAPPPRRGSDVPDAGSLFGGSFGLGPDKPPPSSSALEPRASGAPVSRVLPSDTEGQGGRRAAATSSRGSAGAVAADGGKGDASPNTHPRMGAADGGASSGATPARPGALVISELMVDPKSVTDAEGEWFELFNPSAEPVDLTGCAVADGSEERHSLAGHVTVATHGFVSVARGEQPGFTPDIVATFSLKNGADVLELICDGVTIDRVPYDKTSGFPIAAGVAMALDARNLDADDNDTADLWCLAVESYSSDLGTPGQPNPTCWDETDAGMPADGGDFEFIDAQRDP